jgi:3-dehydroquinate synthetase
MAMEFLFSRKDQETQILYGETLNAVLRTQEIENNQVLILTNQRYYDRFSEKLTRLFLPKEVSWYICTNQMYCNNFTEFQAFMNFLSQFSKQENYLIVGFGNEGVLALSSFVHYTSILTSNLWLIPVSLRALAKSVKETAIILKQPDTPILQSPNLPQVVVYDQTIAEKQKAGKLVDLLLLIRCGLLTDQEFLRELFRTFLTEKQVNNRSFAAYTDRVIQAYQEKGLELEEYGQVFTDAFYKTENGHLLSDAMKLFFGLLFHLIWNAQHQQLSVKLDKLCIWLYQLGYPLVLPDQLSLSEYFQQVLDIQKREKKLLFLSEIGTIGGRTSALEDDLVRTMNAYQTIIKQIRGT